MPTRGIARETENPVQESEGASEPRRTVEVAPRIGEQSWTTLLAVARGTVGGRVREWSDAAERARAAGDLGTAATALVLADLHLQGWAMAPTSDSLFVMPPAATAEAGERPEIVKERLRGGLLAGRASQLADPAVRAFLARMETRRAFRGRRVSVLDLVDDGATLASALADLAALPPSERMERLALVVQPELEIVHSGSCCEDTGYSLTDVWRYFRHTWSLEYRPTPGRSLYFLIRNGARPGRPVMAIGALANATLQMRVRDEWIGWSASAMRRYVEGSPDKWPLVLARMRETVNREVANIRSDDLLAEIGFARGDQLESRLLSLAGQAKLDREDYMRERSERAARGEEVDSLKRLPSDGEGRVEWAKASTSHLFRAKRARTLAELLFAKRILEQSPSLSDLFARDEVARAFSIACREIRKVGLASRLLEVNVCGAVPPYRELLGGKLAAVAVASSEITNAYRLRYANKVSEISSQMAGREIVRDSDLCLVTTTSLYGLAASQYNRVKLTTREGHRVEWVDLGLTEGYGTTQFSEDTVAALRAFSVAQRGGRRVNNLFGEGQSPRLRQVREALDDLGLDSNGLLKHSTPRRVYALELFPGSRECLRGDERVGVQQPSFASIANAWAERWLASRITYRPALERLAREGPNTVRVDLAAPQHDRGDLLTASPAPSTPPPTERRTIRMSTLSNPKLIQDLYRASAACADHHDAQTVRFLHIETSVDEYLRERTKQGGVIFVTGSPGDGKTHLLRRLEPELAASKVQTYLDANEEADEDLIDRIDLVLKRRGRGIAIAINEGILVHLLKLAGDRRWALAARDLLMNPFSFREIRGDEDSTVAVVDLNLRNNLAPAVVRKALNGLREVAGPCSGCPQKRCGIQKNASRLDDASTERLVRLLDVVARTGFHATMRDLQGFLAYILTGPHQCADFKSGAEGRWYWESVFEGGQGPLFDAVRTTLDPHHHTAPLLDDVLWRRADTANDWTTTPPDDVRSGDTLDERQAAFISRKRRALFEHRHGDAVLAAAGTPLERTLSEVLAGGTAATRRIVKLLNVFFARDDRETDVLHLWVTHRYDAQPNRFAASSTTVATSDLEIVVPVLRPGIERAFPDFKPQFALLCLRNSCPETGLRIDRPLLSALLSAEHGMPSPFRRGEPESRIASFFDRTIKSRPPVGDSVVQIRVVDMDTGAQHRVEVDVNAKRYIG